MSWKTPLLLIAALTIAAPAYAKDETRSFAPFTAVDFAGIGALELTVGQEQSVTLSGDADLLPHIITEVKDGTLQIKWDDHRKKDKRSWWWRFVDPSDDDDGDVDTDKKLTVRISMAKLTDVDISGAVTMKAKGIEGDAVSFTASGAGKIKAEGHVNKLALTISGAGKADLEDLSSKEATVTISGAGKADLDVKDKLRAVISGAGKIGYKGDPQVSSHISGFGTVSKN